MEDEMITDYTRKTIKELINTEFVNTMKEYGLPASQHEAFALLNEEIDESYENFIKIINKSIFLIKNTFIFTNIWNN